MIILIFIISIIAGGVASVAGFGIGSLLTPLLSLAIGTKLAVAIVAIPHFAATALRFWLLKSHVDKKVLLGFGLMSAIGGLTGAILNTKFQTTSLTLIFGGILVFSGFVGVSRLNEKVKFHGSVAWVAGIISGVLGGLVGNQGGIRSAALLGFNISKESFVATATATGLIVDSVRMPIYFWNEWGGIQENFQWVVIAVLGTLIGTLLGTKVLKHIPEQKFKQLVSGFILLLGIFMLYSALST